MTVAQQRLSRYFESHGRRPGFRSWAYYPGLEARAIHDPSRFPLAAMLESAYAAIRAESLKAREYLSVPSQGHWNVFHLYRGGERHQANCRLCPRTAAVLEHGNVMRSPLAAACFALLGPLTAVQSHTGPTNIRIRCHLGLQVPRGCAMRIDGRIVRWTPGKCVVFDDSFEHEVWNRSTRERLILMVDLWHPDLTDTECTAIETVQRAVAAGAESSRRPADGGKRPGWTTVL